VTTTGSEQLTGISDAVFDLTSVFYHAAEGSQVYAKYIDDAAKEGDNELVEFFKDVQEQDAERAKKAKSLIGRR
jgi:rubrerythrin